MSKKFEREDDRRQIIPVAEDPELFAFLEEAFDLRDPRAQQPGAPAAKPDKFPERIKLAAVLGVAGRDHGPAVHVEEYKPLVQAAPTREQVVTLSNKLRAKAKHDCNAIGKTTRYGVFLYSSAKGSEAYERFLMVLRPGPKEYSEKDGYPVEEEHAQESAKDRLLELALEQLRWQHEQFSESIGTIMSRQEAQIEALMRGLADSYKAQREVLTLKEDLLDRKAERESAQAIAKVKAAMIAQGAKLVESFAPGVIGYLTRGRAGVDVGVAQFIESLPQEVAMALLGKADDNGRIVERGVLTTDQAQLILSIAGGEAPPLRLAEVARALTPDQLMAAQQLLSVEQIGMLMAMFDAATKNAAPAASANGVARPS